MFDPQNLQSTIHAGELSHANAGDARLYVITPLKRNARGQIVQPRVFLKGEICRSLREARKKAGDHEFSLIHGDVIGVQGTDVRIQPWGAYMRGEELVVTGERRHKLPIFWLHDVEEEGVIFRFPRRREGDNRFKVKVPSRDEY